MTDIPIRPAIPSDAPALAECVRAAYAPYRGLEGLPDVAAGLADDIARLAVWVAVDGERVVGGVVLAPTAPVAGLVNLAVHPDAARQGLGRALVETAVAAARAHGSGALRLATHREMEQTRAFYAGLGWREVGSDAQKVMFELPI